MGKRNSVTRIARENANRDIHKGAPHVNKWVQRLLVLNFLVFFVQQAVPGTTEALWLLPRVMWVRPWTMITYMFIHAGWMHIGFNMLALYFFGTRVEERLGAERFFVLYFISGIAGALLSFVFCRTCRSSARRVPYSE